MLTDLTFLKTFSSNDPVKIAKYVNLYLKAAAPAMEQMKSQASAGDWKSLKTSAHSMKTQLKYMGIATGVDLALFIETSAGEGTNLHEIPAKLTQLEEIVTRSAAELREALAAL